MGLSTVTDIALSGLGVNSDRASVVSRNIVGANDPAVTRKTANVVTLDGGGARVASVTRDVDRALEGIVAAAGSDSARAEAVSAKLDQLQQVFGEPGEGFSPAALVARLRDDIALFAAAPNDLSVALNAVASAKDVADSLNHATRVVQDVRARADSEIAAGVARLNSLLAEFAEVNKAIVEGTRQGRDVTDQEDACAQLVSQMSKLIGVRTLTRIDNDMVVTTEAGVMLFEREPRQLSFQPRPVYDATATGASITVDGLPLEGARTAQVHRTGSLIGLLEVRDETAPTVQSQLDEVARALIVQFAENDQTGGGAATQPGLFTYDLAPAMPGGGLVDGLAGRINVAASVDPDRGGNAERLRDGAISDPGNPAYLYNTSGAASFSARLIALTDAFEAPMAFDANAGLSTSASLTEFAASGFAWVQDQRQTASDAVAVASARLERASRSLSQQSGINLDEEMATMLEIERAYQATARLMASADVMFDSLLAAVR